eukprot:3624778-Amphidinium_carterae.2
MIAYVKVLVFQNECGTSQKYESVCLKSWSPECVNSVSYCYTILMCAPRTFRQHDPEDVGTPSPPNLRSRDCGKRDAPGGKSFVRRCVCRCVDVCVCARACHPAAENSPIGVTKLALG